MTSVVRQWFPFTLLSPVNYNMRCNSLFDSMILNKSNTPTATQKPLHRDTISFFLTKSLHFIPPPPPSHPCFWQHLPDMLLPDFLPIFTSSSFFFTSRKRGSVMHNGHLLTLRGGGGRGEKGVIHPLDGIVFVKTFILHNSTQWARMRSFMSERIFLANRSQTTWHWRLPHRLTTARKVTS